MSAVIAAVLLLLSACIFSPTDEERMRAAAPEYFACAAENVMAYAFAGYPAEDLIRYCALKAGIGDLAEEMVRSANSPSAEVRRQMREFQRQVDIDAEMMWR